MASLNGNGPLVMVDDDELDITLIERCVEKSKLTNQFKAFTSGQAFLDYMDQVKHGVEAMPAIIFLDINMPLMDGFAVLENLRTDDAFQELPVIIFLSNSDNPRDIERCDQLNTEFREKFERIADCVSFLDALAD